MNEKKPTLRLRPGAAMNRPRIVVMISGSGTNLQAIIDAGELGGDIVGVVSDRVDATGLQRAERAGIPARAVALADHDNRVGWEAALVAEVEQLTPDLVVLAGFMRILSGAFVNRWPTVNVHPSLLPAFPGGHAPADAIEWGVKVSGVTVHYVDEQVDHGPIIAQRAVPVEPGDTADTLHARIQAAEHQLLPEVVALICAGRVAIEGRHVRIS